VILGTDITSVAGWDARLRRTPHAARTAFSTDELHARGRDAAALALAWALKESVAKASGLGFAGVSWRAIEVLDIDARAVMIRAPFGSLALGGLAGAWRADIVSDGDRVVAAVVGSRGIPPLSSRLVTLDRCSCERRERRAQLSVAARSAARGAARELLGPTQRLDWERTYHGAPLASCRAGGPALRVSLAHDGDAAVALVGVVGEDADPRSTAFGGDPVTIDFALDRRILDGVRRHHECCTHTSRQAR
jgi:phosphopantetheinyl transferase (holo-ACP synthase)